MTSMALARPILRRQACLALPVRRTISQMPSTLRVASSSSSPKTCELLLAKHKKAGSFLATSLTRASAPASVRVAAFHATTKQSILPAGPQHIDGTANDPAPVPDPTPTHGSYHWTFERLVSAALIPLTVAPFAAGSLNPVTDAVLCATILIHSHIGFESVIIDYIPSKRLPTLRAIFWWGLRAATVLVGVGLYEFETNDVGLTEAIKRIWTA